MSLIESIFGPPNVEKLRSRGDVQGLIKALGYQKTASIREMAAQALGSLKLAEAVGPLSIALTDNAPEVRRCAVSALASLGDERARSEEHTSELQSPMYLV